MSNDKKKVATPVMELTQFNIVERDYEVEVPKYVEVEFEKPIIVEKEYERPVVIEREYEKPVVTIRDITSELRNMVMAEVAKGIMDAIQTLKVSFEIPMARILQVQPGGKVKEVKSE